MLPVLSTWRRSSLKSVLRAGSLIMGMRNYPENGLPGDLPEDFWPELSSAFGVTLPMSLVDSAMKFFETMKRYLGAE